MRRLFGLLRTARPERARRPAVEAMEGRALLAAPSAPPAYVLTPLPEGTPLAEHIHPHLRIIVDGRDVTIPADIGLTDAGWRPLHTHDTSGYIHVEADRPYTFHLRDFFAVWGEPFGRKQVLDDRADARTKIRMFVDGRPSTRFGNLALRDLQEIDIRITHRPSRPGGGGYRPAP